MQVSGVEQRLPGLPFELLERVPALMPAQVLVQFRLAALQLRRFGFGRRQGEFPVVAAFGGERLLVSELPAQHLKRFLFDVSPLVRALGQRFVNLQAGQRL